jgi:hypothetical protein
MWVTRSKPSQGYKEGGWIECQATAIDSALPLWFAIPTPCWFQANHPLYVVKTPTIRVKIHYKFSMKCNEYIFHTDNKKIKWKWFMCFTCHPRSQTRTQETLFRGNARFLSKIKHVPIARNSINNQYITSKRFLVEVYKVGQVSHHIPHTFFVVNHKFL